MTDSGESAPAGSGVTRAIASDATCQVTGEGASLGKPGQHLSVADNDEVPALEVLGRSSATSRIQDCHQVVLRDRLIAELSNDMQRPDRFFDVHRPESRLRTMADKKDPAKRDFPDVVEVVVEIPAGSRNKYEYDMQAGVFRLDRVLSSAVFYNFDYGYITGTLSEDGDPTDALLLIDEPTFPGCHVFARPSRLPGDERREGRRLQDPLRRRGRPTSGPRFKAG